MTAYLAPAQILERNKRRLVYAHKAWHICRQEYNRIQARWQWVYDSGAFCCFVGEEKAAGTLPPIPAK